MVKRGSPYLRWALLQAARLVAMRDTTFRNYYLKKKSEGKHHYVAQSHVAIKLVRVLFHLLTNNISFKP
jgi:transposase